MDLLNQKSPREFYARKNMKEVEEIAAEVVKTVVKK